MILLSISILYIIGCNADGSSSDDPVESGNTYSVVLNELTESITATANREVALSDSIKLTVNTPITLNVSTVGIPDICLQHKGDAKTGIVKIEGSFGDVDTADISLTLDEGFESTDSLAYFDETREKWVTVPSVISEDARTITGKFCHFCEVSTIPGNVDSSGYRYNSLVFATENNDGTETCESFSITYNSSNYIESMTFDHGSSATTYEFVYDSNKITEARLTEAEDGKADEYSLFTYEYNSSDLISKSIFYASDSSWAQVSEDERAIYTYSNGKLIKKELHEAGESGALKGYVEYSYTNDLLTGVKAYTSAAVLEENTTLLWDSRDELLKMEDVGDQLATQFSYNKEAGTANTDFFMLFITNFM